MSLFKSISMAAAAILCAASPMAPPAAAAPSGEIVGNVIYGGYKMASLSLASHKLDPLLSGPNGEYGAVYYDGKYMVLTPEKDTYGDLRAINLTVYDAGDWRVIGTPAAQQSHVRAFDLAYDAASGRIYGCFNTADNVPYFGYISPPQSSSSQLEPVWIADVDPIWYGLAVNAAGEMYAVTKTGTLLKVDKHTGAAVEVGDTGAKTSYLCSATFDPATGAMYYTPNTDSYSRLYSIDVSTAAATKVCDIPGYAELIGIYVAPAAAEPDAPAAPAGLSASFEGLSLSGTVSFTVPSTLYGGSPASGNVTYTVTVGDATVATGTAACGASVDVPVRVDAPGQYTFGVALANAAGAGPRKSLSVYVGPDRPEEPSAVKLAFDKTTSEMKLTWKAPTRGVNGTLLPTDALTYVVSAYPSGKTVEGISSTSYTETVTLPDALTDCHYTVAAVCGGMASGAVASNTVTIGMVTPPYSISFRNPGDIDLCTVIDANRDYTKWEYTENYGGCVKVRYDITRAMDDWLLLPPMRLEGGKSYRVTFRAGTNDSSTRERIEVRAGTAPSPEAMTIDVVAPTDIDKQYKEGGTTPEGYLVAPADGVYYIGFHGISDKDQNWLCLGDVEVAAGLNVGTPGLATDFAVVPDPAGALKADISCTAPATDSDGGRLLSLTRVELYRDGTLIHTFDNPAPGSRLAYTDTGASNGSHTYTVRGFNASGGGMTATATAYVGFDVPSALTSLQVARGDNDGSIRMSWTAPATDIHGKAFAEGAVTYTVMRLEGEQQVTVEEGLTSPACMLQAVRPDASQRFVQYAVFPRSAAGYGEGRPTGLVAVGAPYKLPAAESWAGRLMSLIWGYDGTGGVMLVDDDYFDDTAAQDGDGAYLLIYGDHEGDEVTLLSGRIAIPAGAENPRLMYHCFGMSGCTNVMEAYVRADGADFERVASTELSAARGADGWVRISAPLDAYRGRAVQIKLRALRRNMKYIMLDNIRVYEQASHDIGSVCLSAPATVEAGSTVALGVTYENLGTVAASGLKVSIYRDGSHVATLDAPAVAPGESGHVAYEAPTSTVMPPSIAYTARVEYAADANTADNVSAPAAVALTYPAYPAVSGLTASASPAGVALDWTAPDLDKRPYVADTEDFESGTPFATAAGGWSSVKLDAGRNGAIEGLSIPCVVPGETAAPFFVFDTSIVPDSPGYSHFGAYSGDRYMAAVYNASPDEPLDVLLISPRLCGEAQTVAFRAKSCLSLFAESLEVVYSTGGDAPADFEGNVALRVQALPGEWTRLSAELPEGTEYMAVRATSVDRYMLMIDDIECSLATSQRMELSLLGYNVYRDGLRLNDAPLTSTSYVDTAAPADAAYLVTAVYDRGESVPSEAAVVSGVSAGPVVCDASVCGGRASITVTGAASRQMSVFTPDGRLIHTSECVSDSHTVSVPAGVYIVAVGNLRAKVLVK